jgi:lipid A disaccharide synthetase
MPGQPALTQRCLCCAVAALRQWAALRVATVRHVSLPNLVLRRAALPEAVFAAATPAALAAHLATLLDAHSGAAQAQRVRFPALQQADGRMAIAGSRAHHAFHAAGCCC